MQLSKLLALFFIFFGSNVYAIDDDYYYFFALSSTGKEDLVIFKDYRPKWSGGHSIYGTKKSGSLSQCYKLRREFICRDQSESTRKIVYRMGSEDEGLYNRAKELFVRSSKRNKGFVDFYICEKGCQQGTYSFMFQVSNFE